MQAYCGLTSLVIRADLRQDHKAAAPNGTASCPAAPGAPTPLVTAGARLATRNHRRVPDLTSIVPVAGIPAVIQVQTGTETAADKQVHKIRQLAGDAIEAFNCN